MGSYLSVNIIKKNGKKQHIGNYRCRSCAKNHMPKNQPCFITNHRGKMVMYNKEYKRLAKEKEWKLQGQEVKR